MARIDIAFSMHDKDAEFRAWLVEERKINPETMSKDATKKEFAKFIEDFNTGERIGPCGSLRKY